MKVMFVRDVTVKRQMAVMQQGNRESVEGGVWSVRD